MSEALLSGSGLEQPVLDQAELIHRELLAERLAAYDSTSVEAEHLRPHQTEVIQNFVDVTGAIVNGANPNLGMSILHPTGSGKTVSASEIMRIVSSLTIQDLPSLNVLMLVPGYQVLNQTTGDFEDPGVVRDFVPDLTVGQYSGKKKEMGCNLTVMNYHALGGARERGDIDRINPALVIADEAHHVIDGLWADQVSEIAQGRLLLGLTATPAYSINKHVRRLFPIVLGHKTLREGIEEGILAEMRGFLYQGTSKLEVIARGNKDYTNEEIFTAIANSEDNYLAAAICAAEVAMGRRGVVSCAPGYDRAHAKIMAEILCNTPVKTKGGTRNIRAAYVDGETHPDSLRDIMRDYRNGTLDVLTYVDLLLEGWDSPETEFGVMLRPTKSQVLAEQRVGRIVRPFPGKTATIHEILYEVVGDTQPQRTYLDILDATEVVQGKAYGVRPSSRPPSKPRTGRTGGVKSSRVFDVNEFVLNPGLIKAMARVDLRKILQQDTRVKTRREAIPYTWNSSNVLASKFGISREEASAILEECDVPSKTKRINKVEHRYFSPAAEAAIAEKLGIEKLPDGPERPMTLSDLVEYIRVSTHARRMRPKTIADSMEAAGVKPTRYLTGNNQVVFAYPYESRDVPLTNHVERTGPSEDEQLIPGQVVGGPNLEVVSWLSKVLVNPGTAETAQQRQMIIAAQSCLLLTIKEAQRESEEDYEYLSLELSSRGAEPTEQMRNVMEAKKLSFAELVMYAVNAKTRFDNMNAMRERRSS